MNTVIIVFMIVATVFAIASLAYVVVDMAKENKGEKNQDVKSEEVKPEEVNGNS